MKVQPVEKQNKTKGLHRSTARPDVVIMSCVINVLNLVYSLAQRELSAPEGAVGAESFRVVDLGLLMTAA